MVKGDLTAALKGKKLLFFPFREVSILKKDVAVENHCLTH